MKIQTIVTSKGTTTIPKELRRRAGISKGTILNWELRDRGVFATPNAETLKPMQRHIRTRAGAWAGKISGVELLKRTRG
jgi:bifunctional DNA-binding transcriptional regulator/antitoxin component of YhaV-PrlF toxin-antitoxin module